MFFRYSPCWPSSPPTHFIASQSDSPKRSSPCGACSSSSPFTTCQPASPNTHCNEQPPSLSPSPCTQGEGWGEGGLVSNSGSAPIGRTALFHAICFNRFALLARTIPG